MIYIFCTIGYIPFQFDATFILVAIFHDLITNSEEFIEKMVDGKENHKNVQLKSKFTSNDCNILQRGCLLDAFNRFML